MKIKLLQLMFSLSGLLLLIPSVHGQAIATADRVGRIQAGVGFLYLTPDYTDLAVKGSSFFADYDFRKHIGVEASLHFGNIITPGDIAENSYSIGPRFLLRRHRFTGYAKVLVGRATITNQDYHLSSSYNVISFGGGLEYKLLRRVNLRPVDVEIQKWPDFQPRTLSPVAISVGVAYIMF